MRRPRPFVRRLMAQDRATAEWWLRHYREISRELDAARELEAQRIDLTGGRPSGPSDPTFRQAHRILSDKETRRLRAAVVAMDSVMECLPEKGRWLVRALWIDQELGDHGMQRRLYMSPNRYYYFRRAILEQFAEKLISL